jgi:hypothetical protein
VARTVPRAALIRRFGGWRSLRYISHVPHTRFFSLLIAALALAACEPTETAKHPKSRAKGREPAFTVASKKDDYERGRLGLGAIDALRGSTMTEAMATDLGYKCADLRSIDRSLASEHDPLVWRLRTDIEKTCDLDVPLVSALFEIDRIEKKRAKEPDANLRGECLGLRLAIGDIGSSFVENPAVVDVGGKFARYCESGGDSVRRMP